MAANLTPTQLANRMGISPKRLRAMLRSDHPRKLEEKGKKWELDPQFAKKVEADYKAKKAKAEAEKKAQIEKELKGEEPQDQGQTKEPAGATK